MILEEASISPRMSSLIINLVEMRKNGWKAPLSKGQGPKTMKQIQEEFERYILSINRNANNHIENTVRCKEMVKTTEMD